MGDAGRRRQLHIAFHAVVGGIVGSRLDPSASILWLTLLLEEVVEPEVLVGIYSNPHHVVEYGDGEVRQQFSVCFACRLVGGELTTSDESLEVGFFTPAEITTMPLHESIRLRIHHYLEHRPQPVIA